jgi:hypothetical protein
MSLEELNLDGGEVWGSSSEAPREQTEKQKESARKAQSQLQKTQKDEKKAKGDNDDLFHILSRFIKNPLYEELIPSTVVLLQNSYPSRFILIIIALVYPEATYFIFEKLSKKISTDLYTKIHHYSEPHMFHDENIHPSIREWITLWMTQTQEYILQKENSVILAQKTKNLLSSDTRESAQECIKTFFIFFLSSRNAIISPNKANLYAEFILTEYEKTIDIFLIESDGDLTKESNINMNNLFWL